MAMTNIAINDGKAVPVLHTFVPGTAQIGEGKSAVAATWYNKLTGFSSRAWEKVTTLIQLATKPSEEHRLSMSVQLPKVVIVDGKEVVIGTIRGYASVVMPQDLNTDDNAKDVFALLKNALAHAEMTKVFATQSTSG